MAHSYLIFDFGKNEETAQQARHKVESWKQGFRLGSKITIKFEREEPAEENDDAAENAEASAADQGSSKTSAKHPAEKHSSAAKNHAAEGKRGGKKKSTAMGAKDDGGKDEEEGSANVRVIVRLDFSDHEKLSLQRWLDRIPTEEPFKSVGATVIRQGDPEFGKTSTLFETLG